MARCLFFPCTSCFFYGSPTKPLLSQSICWAICLFGKIWHACQVLSYLHEAQSQLCSVSLHGHPFPMSKELLPAQLKAMSWVCNVCCITCVQLQGCGWLEVMQPPSALGRAGAPCVCSAAGILSRGWCRLHADGELSVGHLDVVAGYAQCQIMANSLEWAVRLCVMKCNWGNKEKCKLLSRYFYACACK